MRILIHSIIIWCLIVTPIYSQNFLAPLSGVKSNVPVFLAPGLADDFEDRVDKLYTESLDDESPLNSFIKKIRRMSNREDQNEGLRKKGFQIENLDFFTFGPITTILKVKKDRKDIGAAIVLKGAPLSPNIHSSYDKHDEQFSYMKSHITENFLALLSTLGIKAELEDGSSIIYLNQEELEKWHAFTQELEALYDTIQKFNEAFELNDTHIQKMLSLMDQSDAKKRDKILILFSNLVEYFRFTFDKNSTPITKESTLRELGQEPIKVQSLTLAQVVSQFQLLLIRLKSKELSPGMASQYSLYALPFNYLLQYTSMMEDWQTRRKDELPRLYRQVQWPWTYWLQSYTNHFAIHGYYGAQDNEIHKDFLEKTTRQLTNPDIFGFLRTFLRRKSTPETTKRQVYPQLLALSLKVLDAQSQALDDYMHYYVDEAQQRWGVSTIFSVRGLVNTVFNIAGISKQMEIDIPNWFRNQTQTNYSDDTILSIPIETSDGSSASFYDFYGLKTNRINLDAVILSSTYAGGMNNPNIEHLLNNYMPELPPDLLFQLLRYAFKKLPSAKRLKIRDDVVDKYFTDFLVLSQMGPTSSAQINFILADIDPQLQFSIFYWDEFEDFFQHQLDYVRKIAESNSISAPIAQIQLAYYEIKDQKIKTSTAGKLGQALLNGPKKRKNAKEHFRKTFASLPQTANLRIRGSLSAENVVPVSDPYDRPILPAVQESNRLLHFVMKFFFEQADSGLKMFPTLPAHSTKIAGEPTFENEYSIIEELINEELEKGNPNWEVLLSMLKFHMGLITNDSPISDRSVKILKQLIDQGLPDDLLSDFLLLLRREDNHYNIIFPYTLAEWFNQKKINREKYPKSEEEAQEILQDLSRFSLTSLPYLIEYLIQQKRYKDAYDFLDISELRIKLNPMDRSEYQIDEPFSPNVLANTVFSRIRNFIEKRQLLRNELRYNIDDFMKRAIESSNWSQFRDVSKYLLEMLRDSESIADFTGQPSVLEWDNPEEQRAFFDHANQFDWATLLQLEFFNKIAAAIPFNHNDDIRFVTQFIAPNDPIEKTPQSYWVAINPFIEEMFKQRKELEKNSHWNPENQKWKSAWDVQKHDELEHFAKQEVFILNLSRFYKNITESKFIKATLLLQIILDDPLFEELPGVTRKELSQFKDRLAKSEKTIREQREELKNIFGDLQRERDSQTVTWGKIGEKVDQVRQLSQDYPEIFEPELFEDDTEFDKLAVDLFGVKASAEDRAEQTILKLETIQQQIRTQQDRLTQEAKKLVNSPKDFENKLADFKKSLQKLTKKSPSSFNHVIQAIDEELQNNFNQLYPRLGALSKDTNKFIEERDFHRLTHLIKVSSEISKIGQELSLNKKQPQNLSSIVSIHQKLHALSMIQTLKAQRLWLSVQIETDQQRQEKYSNTFTSGGSKLTQYKGRPQLSNEDKETIHVPFDSLVNFSRGSFPRRVASLERFLKPGDRFSFFKDIESAEQAQKDSRPIPVFELKHIRSIPEDKEGYLVLHLVNKNQFPDLNYRHLIPKEGFIQIEMDSNLKEQERLLSSIVRNLSTQFDRLAPDYKPRPRRTEFRGKKRNRQQVVTDEGAPEFKLDINSEANPIIESLLGLASDSVKKSIHSEALGEETNTDSTFMNWLSESTFYPAQKQALLTIFNALQSIESGRQLVIVAAPGGTGKTYSLSQLSKYLLQLKKRIAATGPTHSSVDTLLIEHLENEITELVRIAHDNNVEKIHSDSLTFHRWREQQLSLEGKSGKPTIHFHTVTGYTGDTALRNAEQTAKSEGISNDKFRERMHRDILHVDEASMVTFPELLLIAQKRMQGTRPTILWGDPLQLPPFGVTFGEQQQIRRILGSTAIKDFDGVSLDRTLFKDWVVDLISTSSMEMLFGQYGIQSHYLNENRRSTPVIVELLNRMQYHQKQMPMISKKESAISPKKQVIFLNITENSNQDEELIDTRSGKPKKGKYISRAEIKAILTQMNQDFLDEEMELEGSHITFISPYQSQIDLFKRAKNATRLLSELDRSITEKKPIETSTITETIEDVRWLLTNLYDLKPDEVLKALSSSLFSERVRVNNDIQAMTTRLHSIFKDLIPRDLKGMSTSHLQDAETLDLNDAEATTIQKVQGQENRAVYISYVRNNHGGKLGFLFSKKGKHMQITATGRAKEILRVAANKRTWERAANPRRRSNTYLARQGVESAQMMLDLIEFANDLARVDNIERLISVHPVDEAA